MQYLLYYVVCFKNRSTTRQLFVANVVSKATLANCGVFTRQHAQDAMVASMWYKRANGILFSSNSDTDNP